MACVPCGDIDQSCCAGEKCTNGGVFCDGGGVCALLPAWGHSCGAGGVCGEKLECNQENFCQNKPEGVPHYGSSCTNSGYCESGPSTGLSCVKDTITKFEGNTFYRCGCAKIGGSCTTKADQHQGICQEGNQTWEPLTPPSQQAR